MQERPSLRSIQLTGPRAIVRRIVLASLPVFAAVGAIGYVLPAHQLRDGERYHSNFADGGVPSLLVFGAVIVLTYLLGKRRFGAGVLAGALAMGGAVLAVAPVVLAHFLSNVDHALGEHVFVLGILTLFVAGGLAIVVEPIVYVVERRRIVNAAKPAPLPAARIIPA